MKEHAQIGACNTQWVIVENRGTFLEKATPRATPEPGWKPPPSHPLQGWLLHTERINRAERRDKS